MNERRDIAGTRTTTRPAAGSGDHGLHDDRRGTPRRRSMAPWIIALLVVIALAVAGFFLLGGDVDSDSEGEFDVQTPRVDVDVDGPNVSVERPDIDVDPGAVKVEEGDADADASSND